MLWDWAPIHSRVSMCGDSLLLFPLSSLSVLCAHTHTHLDTQALPLSDLPEGSLDRCVSLNNTIRKLLMPQDMNFTPHTPSLSLLHYTHVHTHHTHTHTHAFLSLDLYLFSSACLMFDTQHVCSIYSKSDEYSNQNIVCVSMHVLVTCSACIHLYTTTYYPLNNGPH